MVLCKAAGVSTIGMPSTAQLPTREASTFRKVDSPMKGKVAMASVRPRAVELSDPFQRPSGV
ncbi:hypothetical protein ASD99_12775 [Mesorhizobium sp. Root695]|nr:hypothetical protein ASD99_12775 [Mesorhizobium sp. Root695]